MPYGIAYINHNHSYYILRFLCVQCLFSSQPVLLLRGRSQTTLTIFYLINVGILGLPTQYPPLLVTVVRSSYCEDLKVFIQKSYCRNRPYSGNSFVLNTFPLLLFILAQKIESYNPITQILAINLFSLARQSGCLFIIRKNGQVKAINSECTVAHW